MVFFATKFTLGKTTATATATLINNIFDKQNNVMICKASTLLVHDYHAKFPYASCYGGRKHTKGKFSFSFKI